MGNINQSGEHCQKQYRCVVRPILSKQPSRVSCTLAEPSARARTLWSSDGCDHEDFNVRQSDVFFQPLLLVNFVFDRNETYTAKSCLRCTRKSVSEFNLRYLNSIPKRVTEMGWTAGHPCGSFNFDTIGQFYFPVFLNTLEGSCLLRCGSSRRSCLVPAVSAGASPRWMTSLSHFSAT